MASTLKLLEAAGEIFIYDEVTDDDFFKVEAVRVAAHAGMTLSEFSRLDEQAKIQLCKNFKNIK